MPSQCLHAEGRDPCHAVCQPKKALCLGAQLEIAEAMNRKVECSIEQRWYVTEVHVLLGAPGHQNSEAEEDASATSMQKDRSAYMHRLHGRDSDSRSTLNESTLNE